MKLFKNSSGIMFRTDKKLDPLLRRISEWPIHELLDASFLLREFRVQQGPVPDSAHFMREMVHNEQRNFSDCLAGDIGVDEESIVNAPLFICDESLEDGV